MTDEPCQRCGHPQGPHILAATIWANTADGREIPAGGHMFCPLAGCECHNTWSVPDEVAGFDVKARLAADGPMDPDAIKRVRGH